MKLLHVSGLAQRPICLARLTLFLSNCCVHFAIILDYGVVVIKTINIHVLDYFVIHDYMNCMKTFIMLIKSDVRPRMCCNVFVLLNVSIEQCTSVTLN